MRADVAGGAGDENGLHRISPDDFVEFRRRARSTPSARRPATRTALPLAQARASAGPAAGGNTQSSSPVTNSTGIGSCSSSDGDLRAQLADAPAHLVAEARPRPAPRSAGRAGRAPAAPSPCARRPPDGCRAPAARPACPASAATIRRLRRRSSWPKSSVPEVDAMTSARTFFGLAQRVLQAGPAAHRLRHQRDVIQLQFLDERGKVVGIGIGRALAGHRARGRKAAVREHDAGMGGREVRDLLPPGKMVAAQAVREHDRRPLAEHLVVDLPSAASAGAASFAAAAPCASSARR